MDKTIASKIGVKDGYRVYFQNVPDELIGRIKSPGLELAAGLSGEFDYIHIFETKREDLLGSIEKLKPHLSQRGSLWVSWLKMAN